MANRIEPGIYKARGIEGSAQKGHTKKGIEQLALDLEIPELGRTLTTFLFFSDDAAPYALERLEALGWEPTDDPRFPGISRNEVDVQIKYEMYDDGRGGGPKETMKVDIMTAGGRVVLKDAMSAQEERGFMSRILQLKKMHGGPAVAKTEPAPSGGAGGKLAL